MTNDETILSIYLKDINKIPLLSREEEEDLAKKAHLGDKHAKDKIVRSNLRFVVNVAKKYQNNRLDLIDLISEGNIGLINAIERFDVDKGYHFISYAVWWIRQAILKAICEKSRAIRLPSNRANELVQIETARKSLSGNKSESEEFEEIAALLNMKKSHVREMVNISRDMLSLDARISQNDGDSSSVSDYIEDERYPSPVETTINHAMQSDIEKVLSTLRPSEANVLRLRFGLNGYRPMSLKEVGDSCNLTKERIRQIEKHALHRMRHPRRLRELEAYVA